MPTLFRQLLRVLDGRPACPAPLLSATLESDDAALAGQWLARPAQWHDEGPVREWERQFADWLGAGEAFAFMGGRAALYAVVQALDLRAGDAVVVPAFTCQCVVNAFRYHGIDLVYADIDPDTYGLDAASVERALTPACKAVMLQYSFGLISRDLEATLALARQRRLKVIEDCAHATGASLRGRKLGTFGDIAIFSSERSKIINTIHGGTVVTRDPALIERMRGIRRAAPLPDAGKIEKLLDTVIHNHYTYAHPQRWLTAQWAEWRYGRRILPQMFAEEFRGEYCAHYRERMPAPVAALALNQLRKIDGFHRRRLHAAAHWDRWCEDQGYRKPLVVADSDPAFLRYPVCVAPEMKQDVGWAERQLDVIAGVWFTSAAHPLPLEPDNCPNGARAARECVNLPTLL